MVRDGTVKFVSVGPYPGTTNILTKHLHSALLLSCRVSVKFVSVGPYPGTIGHANQTFTLLRAPALQILKDHEHRPPIPMQLPWMQALFQDTWWSQKTYSFSTPYPLTTTCAQPSSLTMNIFTFFAFA